MHRALGSVRGRVAFAWSDNDSGAVVAFVPEAYPGQLSTPVVLYVSEVGQI